MALQIVVDDLSSSEIRSLLELHAAEMQAASPDGACHFLPVDGLFDPAVTVWSAWRDGRLAGCGALQELDARHGEVKSMRTHPDHLGSGIGAAVLDRIVGEARARRYEWLGLETGSGEPFAAAVRLYRRAGFVRCGPFGGYADNGFSRFFSLALDGST